MKYGEVVMTDLASKYVDETIVIISVDLSTVPYK